MKRKLIIEDFGKIKQAEIEISPLTLFVGDNNSGKSYLLSLIFGFLRVAQNFIVEIPSTFRQRVQDLCWRKM